MTWQAALLGSLMKSVLITALGLLISRRLMFWIQQRPQRTQSLTWLLILAPCLIPSLMTGYCYRDTVVSLVRHPYFKELLYSLVVAAQAIPIAVLVLRFAPPSPVSATAVQTARLFRPRGLSLWRLQLQAHARSTIPAAAVLFLLSFQEADLASLMQTVSWTEWIYMRHAGGLPVNDSLRYVLVPLCIQVPLMLGVLAWVLPEGEAGEISRRDSNLSRWAIACVWCWIILSWLVVVLVPGIQLLRGARQGLGALWQQPSTWKELGDAALIGLTSAGLAWGASWGFLRGGPGRRRRIERGTPGRILWAALIALLICPGLTGGLTLGLVVSNTFQTDLFLPAYDGPLPLIFAETLWLIPRVLILQCCLSRLSTGTEQHELTILFDQGDRRQREMARQIHWQRAGRASCGVLVLAFLWSYLEVMLPSMLAMPGLVPVSLVLYNALHYGRITALAAKLVLAMTLPLILWGFLSFTRRLWCSPGSS